MTASSKREWAISLNACSVESFRYGVRYCIRFLPRIFNSDNTHDERDWFGELVEWKWDERDEPPPSETTLMRLADEAVLLFVAAKKGLDERLTSQRPIKKITRLKPPKAKPRYAHFPLPVSPINRRLRK